MRLMRLSGAVARLIDRSREVSTSWEPRLTISVGAPCDYPSFFSAVRHFVDRHTSVELDISEHILRAVCPNYGPEG